MAQNSIPYSGVPTVEPSLEGSGAKYQSVPEAKPEAFGAQIGQGLDKVGSAANDLGQKYTQMANEAAANDVIANQFVPKVTQLAGDYYKLQGKDAIAGFQPYVQSLQQARADTLQNLPPAQANLVGSFITRHVTNEYDTAMRHQTQQMNAYEDQTNSAMLGSLSSLATANYNQPKMVDTNLNSGLALIQKHGIDRGQSPEEITENQRQFASKTAQDMVGRAVANGDVATAQSIYHQYQNKISGSAQLNIDKMLHAENMRQFGNNAASALLAGNPIPNPPAGQPAQVKSVVADTAQRSGVPPVQALTVASIESDFGQNVGKRGDIWQTGKGGDIPEQAQNLVSTLKQSKPLADTATGRQSEPWEQYVVYQQRPAGGSALLKAAATAPMAKAVDVLAPLYNSPKEALSAVTNNGGNATMTAGQFLDTIKVKYNLHAENAAMDIAAPAASTAPNPLPNEQSVITSVPPQSAGAAILAPHQNGGLTMQPATSPVQRLIQMDKVFPDAIMRANQIPNLDQREATLNSLEQQHRVYQAASQAYTTTLVNQAEQLAVDPKFTDPNTIPSDLRAALIEDHPQTLAYLENRANYNLEHQSGASSKDQKEYGPGIDGIMSKVFGGQISNVGQLQEAYNNKEISVAGYDKAKVELAAKGTPEGDATAKLKDQTFTTVKSWFLGKSEAFGIPDPEAQASYGHAMALMFEAEKQAQDDAAKKGVPVSKSIYDPESKDWIGNVAKPLVKTLPQRMEALNQKLSGSSAAITLPPLKEREAGKTTANVGGKEYMWQADGKWYPIAPPQLPVPVVGK